MFDSHFLINWWNLAKNICTELMGSTVFQLSLRMDRQTPLDPKPVFFQVPSDGIHRENLDNGDEAKIGSGEGRDSGDDGGSVGHVSAFSFVVAMLLRSMSLSS